MAAETVTQDYEALRADLKSLRDDVAALAETLVVSGKERAQAAGHSAVEEARRRLEQISSRTHAACDRSREVADTFGRQVMDHPCKSLTIVFGAGLLVGMLLNLVIGHRRT